MGLNEKGSRRLWGKGAAEVFVALAVGSLFGCTVVPTNLGGQGTSTVTPAPAMTLGGVAIKPLPPGAEVPIFTGPWADNFRFAYLNSQSDLQREVLKDGAISDQEISALRDAFIACAEQRGLVDVMYMADGSLSLSYGKGMSDREVDDIVRDCGTPTTDGVEVLYAQIQTNPSNKDMATIMAECLVRVGLAPPGYSRQDYLRDSPADSFPFDSNSTAFGACVRDPLGATKK